jgi:hypothetical protein
VAVVLAIQQLGSEKGPAMQVLAWVRTGVAVTQEVQVVADPEQVAHGDVHAVQVDATAVPEAKYPGAHVVHDVVEAPIVAHGMQVPIVAVTVETVYPTAQRVHTPAAAVEVVP